MGGASRIRDVQLVGFGSAPGGTDEALVVVEGCTPAGRRVGPRVQTQGGASTAARSQSTRPQPFTQPRWHQSSAGGTNGKPEAHQGRQAGGTTEDRIGNADHGTTVPVLPSYLHYPQGGRQNNRGGIRSAPGGNAQACTGG